MAASAPLTEPSCLGVSRRSAQPEARTLQQFSKRSKGPLCVCSYGVQPRKSISLRDSASCSSSSRSDTDGSPLRPRASSRAFSAAAPAPPPLAPLPAAVEILKQGLDEPSADAGITHLELNSWILEVGGARLLVDPILEGPLDFGLPSALLKIYKKKLQNLGAASVADAVDAVLLTQSWEDHCNAQTISALARIRPTIPIVAPPSAAKGLAPLFPNVSLLAPGETLRLNTIVERPLDRFQVLVRATAGAQVGPPWEKPENGYIVSCAPSGSSPSAPPSFSLYIEPHCTYDPEELGALQADVVVSHPFKVLLAPGVPLLDGMDSALRLAQLLKCRTFVPYCNDESIPQGILAKVFSNVEGSKEECQELFAQQAPDVEFLVPEPGKKIKFNVELS